MQWHSDGSVTWRGCLFVPFNNLPLAAQSEARETFSPNGRQGVWREITSWAFALRKDGHLSKCKYIEPLSGLRG